MPNRRLLWTSSGVIAALWVGLLGGVIWAHHHLNADRPTLLATPASTATWDAPPFAFADQDGRRTTGDDLRGHPYVADFIFTTCTTACPTLTAKLALLRQQVTSPDARFVSFSVDPAHDTPAVLKAYAGEWGRPDPRWRLLSTDPAGLAAVARGFRVVVAATGEADNPILHSTLLLLVDAGGTVRGAYDSTDADETARLADDLRGLVGTAPAATDLAVPPDDGTAAGRGRQVYAAMSCNACHGQPRVAPPLASVFNSMVRLADGTTVWADEAYLHESIASPAAKVVAGYLNSMPSYRGHLSDAQTADLVAYVESLSGNPPGGHGLVAGPATTRPAAVVVDPVCHMRVAANPAGWRSTVNGRTFHFCSDACRQKFDHDPAKYGAELLTSGRRAGP